MANKNPNSAGYGAASSGDSGSVSNPSSAPGRSGISRYIGIIAIALVVIVIAYYLLTSLGGQSLTSKQIFENVSSSGLNQTQSLFVKDLARSENVSDLQVSYYSKAATQHVVQSSNLAVNITSNQTIRSYKLGSYNKTVMTSITAYADSKNGDVLEKNVSSIYYYNTNTTLICFNYTEYSMGQVTNSSLQCGSGDQGQNYIEETPFTAVNVSMLSYLVFNNTVTNNGARTIAGRGCDDFIISNATSSNLHSNYSVFNLCIDRQYGIPLYFNETDVTGGVPASFDFIATNVSTSVPSSEFIIPPQYLKAA